MYYVLTESMQVAVQSMNTGSTELFPSSPRVVYRDAPLIQVICQLKFPTLLSIEDRVPVDFQEKIRDRFPFMEKGVDRLPPNVPPEIAQIIQGQSGSSGYRFLTEDRSSTVTLGSDALALTTDRYTRWEEFFDQLRHPLVALNEIYSPSFFSRIGLRYQDAIDRKKLGLQGTPWSKLLRKEILGELALPQFEENLEGVASRTLRVKIPDGSGSVYFRHGLAALQGRDEECYMIDIDLFTEQMTEVQNAEATLGKFNVLGGRAFRWCITDNLRAALKPSELADAIS